MKEKGESRILRRNWRQRVTKLFSVMPFGGLNYIIFMLCLLKTKLNKIQGPSHED